MSVPNVIHQDSNSEGSSESTTDSEDDEYDPSEIVADSDETLEYTSSDSSATDSCNESPLSDVETTPSTLGATKPQTSSTMCMASNPSLPFKLVGDNLDKNIRPRYQRFNVHRTKSLHYFHSYAVRDRISFQNLPFTHPSHCLPSKQRLAESLLPSTADDDMLRGNISTIIARILVQHTEFFNKTFSDVAEWHITHPFYEEMSCKSEVVSCMTINFNLHYI